MRTSALERTSGLILAALLLAGCVAGRGTPAGPEPTPGLTATASDALRFDAEQYAEKMGVPVEEAIRRLSLQDLIGDLQVELQQHEGATFGGLWIQHEPEYRVVVAFTRSGKETLRPYVEGTPLEGLVEIRKARFTLVELEAILAQAASELDKLDFEVMTSLSVQDNRVEVTVSDRAWVESEMERVGARLPEGAELVVIEGGSTARDKDLLLTPPVPGIAFPRQKPAEGPRVCMMAVAVGTLQLEGVCLRVETLQGGAMLPIWPPEYTLRAEGERLLVIDGAGQVAARTGEEVYLSGGSSPVSDEWVLQQIPAACRGETWIVCAARPNLRTDSDLFALDLVSTPGQTALFLRYKPALGEQLSDAGVLAGKLVVYDYRRCVHLQTDSGPGSATLLWPLDWSLRAGGGEITVVDGAGQAVARVGDDLSLRVRPVPHDMDFPAYRQLVDELPGDCVGASWLVDGVE